MRTRIAGTGYEGSMKTQFVWYRAGIMGLVIILLTVLFIATNAYTQAQTPTNQPISPARVPEQQQDTTPTPNTSLPEGIGPWVVRAYFSDRQMVNDLATWHEPWEVRYDEDLAEGYIVLDVTRSEYARLLQAGFQLTVDTRLTAQLHKPNIPLADQTGGIPGFPCYRTVEETFATAEQIVATYPDLAAWIDVGDSWEKTQSSDAGYDMMVLRLTNRNTPGPKPIMFITSSIHAREYTPAELTTRFAEYLVQHYDQDADVTWLLDYHEIHLMLMANPDGRKVAEAGFYWRKNRNTSYGTACADPPTMYEHYGVDLNRNFAFGWDAGDGDVCDPTFSGPSPASEPETQVVQNYIREQFVDANAHDPYTYTVPITATGMYIDIHSYGNLVLWPWGNTQDHTPNHESLQTLGRKLAYFNDYTPQQAIELYPTKGTTDSFAYGEVGVAAYTFELGNAFFESCGTFENIIFPDNLQALLYAAKVLRSPYATPAGPDVGDMVISPVGAIPGDTVHITATLDDARYSHAMGIEPNQAITNAEYFIDVPPWSTTSATTSTSSNAMLAIDGAFDENVEPVTGVLNNTTDLQPGRHTIFVRGKDADGNWGPVSATFFYVLDANTAPFIEGYIRDAQTNEPLAATITAAPFSTTTDPSTGYYRMQVAEGTYTLTIVAEGYATTTIEHVAAQRAQTIEQNVTLYPMCEVFNDTVEMGNQGWSAEGTWAISTEESHSTSHAWTDSPDGSYASETNYALVSPIFDLSQYQNITLDFWHIYELEEEYDYGYVDYSTDGGSTWSEARYYNGYHQTEWTREHLALPALDGQAQARIRFRLATDEEVVKDGWSIDDIVLSGGGLGCVAPQDIYAPQAIAINGPSEGKTSQTYTFVATVNPPNTATPITYTWQTSDQAQSLVHTDTSISNTITLQWDTPGTKLITVTATNAAQSVSTANTFTVENHMVYLPLITKPKPMTPFGFEANNGRLSRAAVLNKAKQLDATWVRLNAVSWRDVQPEHNGALNWGAMATFEQDLLAAAEANLTPMVIVDNYPDWATKYEKQCSALKEEHFQDFAAFMQAVVQRYSQAPYNVHYWELGNEVDVDPDIARFPELFGCWGDDDDPYYGGEYYGAMLKVVTPAIKQVDPSAKVLIGGLLLDSPETENDNTGKPEDFLEGILRAGAGPYFDILPIHAYPYYSKVNPDNDAADSRWESLGGLTKGKIAYVREVLNKYGEGDKPLSLNEVAYLFPHWFGDDPTGTDFFEAQANHVVRQLSRGLAAGVQSYCWYTIHASGWYFSGLLNSDNTPRPVYTAYQTFIEQTEYTLNDTPPVQITSYGDGANVEAYRFSKGNTVLDVLWSTNGETHYVDVPVDAFVAAYSRDGTSVETDELSTTHKVPVGVSPVYIVRTP